jgi:hypothetical protein
MMVCYIIGAKGKLFRDHSKGHSKKKQKIESEPADEPDDFDVSQPIDITKDLCCFCKQGHACGVKLKELLSSPVDDETVMLEADATKHTMLDADRVWASLYSLQCGVRRIFAHFQCASFTSRAWLDERSTWINLRKEVFRSRGLNCGTCNKGGALLPCSVPRCRYNAHVTCAVMEGFRVSRYSHRYVCPPCKRKEASETEINVTNIDFSRGKEPLPVLSEINPVEMPSFEYTTQNYDSHDVLAFSRHVLEIDSCKCEGLCDDVALCKCQRDSGGRNYMYNGQLVPGRIGNDAIVECNDLCKCSIRYGHSFDHKMSFQTMHTIEHYERRTFIMFLVIVIHITLLGDVLTE